MGKCCGRGAKKNRPVDKHGNSLSKYAYLHPNQKKLLESQITEEPAKVEAGEEPKQ